MKYDTEIGFWEGIFAQGNVPTEPDGRYLKHLLVPADYFEGMKVLEIGPGPLPWSKDFTGCEIIGLDPLVEVYRQIGFACDHMEYVEGYAELMPFPDDSFDAVISFNALDHVDDFEQTISEIERVCKGVIRVELHYHEAWPCEPMELDDKRVRKAFSPKVKKLIERPYGDTFFPGHPESPSYTGTVSIWSNDPHIEKCLL